MRQVQSAWHYHKRARNPTFELRPLIFFNYILFYFSFAFHSHHLLSFHTLLDRSVRHELHCFFSSQDLIVKINQRKRKILAASSFHRHRSISDRRWFSKFLPSLSEEMADDKGVGEVEKKEKETIPTAAGNGKKKQRGIFSRIWNGIFRLHGDDFEKRLKYISKEEAAVLSRMSRRSQSWRRITRHLIIFSVIFEVIAVGYAIMTTRSMDINWKMRAIRVLPMFLLPALSSAAYSSFVSFTQMCDRRDQKILERLRAERQAKIDELKEKTNYYTTQQLIQRYDPDPAAKAAAATVLASKLGADSGLKMYVADESKPTAPAGKSHDVELVQSSGLRNRKQLQSRSTSPGAMTPILSDQQLVSSGGTDPTQNFEHNQLVVVEHHQPQSSTPNDGGWIARIAALLVGEDPTQSYALICGNCHMHNGLARKEDFPYITYFCPHCHALNKPKQLDDHVSGSDTPNMGFVKSKTMGSPITGFDDAVKTTGSSAGDSTITSNSSVNASPGIEEEVSERGS